MLHRPEDPKFGWKSKYDLIISDSKNHYIRIHYHINSIAKEQLRRDLDLARLREQQSHADAADADTTAHRKRCEEILEKEQASNVQFLF